MKYYNSKGYQKKCNTVYIPLINPYKGTMDTKKHFKGYENDDNLSFLRYKIK